MLKIEIFNIYTRVHGDTKEMIKSMEDIVIIFLYKNLQKHET